MPRDRSHVIESVVECIYPEYTVYTVRYTGGSVRKIETSLHRIPQTLFKFLSDEHIAQRCVMRNVNEYYRYKPYNEEREFLF